jgi:hypothetical protein
VTTRKGAPTGAPSPITEGTLVRVVKAGSGHYGWTARVGTVHPNGRSAKVNLGSGKIRSYMLDDLEVI